jgi:OOP family OmpA-OmpF porin
MHETTRSSAYGGLICAMILVFAATAFPLDNTKIKGVIVGRAGADVIVRTQSGNVTVTLNDNTKVEVVKGVFGIRKEQMAMTALVPGLPVEVQTQESGGQTLALTVKFKAGDLKAAHDMQAAITPTDQKVQANQQNIQGQEKQIQANQQKLQAQEKQIQTNEQQVQQVQGEEAALSKRFGELADYDVKGTVTVYFGVNSTDISEKGRQELNALAASATNYKGYMLQVAGYTDSSGNAAYNEELSERRAEAVVSYLQQTCGVPLFRVLAPAAMGMSHPAASNETQQGMAENRRVVVKVLVNRGMSGQ